MSTHTEKTRDPFISVLASLAAAISLLERSSVAKRAAPSDKMFDKMIGDYKKALEAGRAALSAAPVGEPLRRIVLDTLNAVAPAVENLSVHQEQCDRDGVMVKVSRQALDEVLNAVNEVAMQSAITTSPASPVAQEPVATKKVYIKPLRTIVEIQTAYADQIRDWLNTSTPAPPATSAGVGADEIARALANSLGMDLDEEERMAARGHSPSQNYLNEWNKYANAILAFLSRAGVQSNSTQKDGSR